MPSVLNPRASLFLAALAQTLLFSCLPLPSGADHTFHGKTFHEDAPPRPAPPPVQRFTGELRRHPDRSRNVALCFFGLTRSLSQTITTIRQSLIWPLEGAGFNVDVFLHTYSLTHLSNPWAEEDINLNTTEWTLLNPVDAVITNQDDFMRDRRHEIRSCQRHGNGWPSTPGFQTLYNHLCQLNSLKAVSELWRARHASENYYAVIYARADVLFDCPLPTEYLANVQEDTLYSPDHSKADGVNDRFAIARPKIAELYGRRLDLTFAYCEGGQASRARRVHSEKMLLRLVKDQNISVVEIPRFSFYRVRANGLAALLDVFNLAPCNLERVGRLHVHTSLQNAAALWNRKRAQAKQYQAL